MIIIITVHGESFEIFVTTTMDRCLSSAKKTEQSEENVEKMKQEKKKKEKNEEDCVNQPSGEMEEIKMVNEGGEESETNPTTAEMTFQAIEAQPWLSRKVILIKNPKFQTVYSKP